MKSLTRLFSALVWRRTSFLLGMLTTAFVIGLFFKINYQQFIHIQSQNFSGLSVFSEMILPVAGLTLICQLLMLLLASVNLPVSFNAAGQGSILALASIKPGQRLMAMVKPVLLAGLWPLLIFCLILLLTMMHSSIDYHRLLTMLTGLFVISCVCSFICLSVSMLASSVLLAIVQMILCFGFILIVDNGLRVIFPSVPWSGLFNPFLNLREGLILLSDLVSLTGWFIVSFTTCYWAVVRKSGNRFWKIKVLFFFGLIALLTAGLFPGQIDLTENKRNSLSQQIAEQLIKLGQPLKIKAVIYNETHRDQILYGFSLIREIYPDTELSFQSRQSLGPEFKHTGEFLQFEAGNLLQSVAYPFKQGVKYTFELALKEMLNRKQQWITFIEGHGEASPFSKTTSSLSLFYKALKNNGWSVAVQNLTQVPVISDNTKLLVIASGKKQWLPAETRLVLNYLKQGKNLLLMMDPDSFVPAAVEEYTGITKYSGTLVDWRGYESGTPHPAVVIVHDKGEHPVTEQLDSMLAFPWSAGLKLVRPDKSGPVKIEKVLTTHHGVWSEFNIRESELSFDADAGELKQAFTLAMSYFNSNNNQRIFVIGDSHFASDTAINNYSNKQFSLNLISWLTSSELVSINDLKDKDHSFESSRAGVFTINWVFPLFIPVTVFLVWIAARRKRFSHVS